MNQATREFNHLFRTMSDVNKGLQNIKPGSFSVSTMTIQGKLSAAIDVAEIGAAMERGDIAFPGVPKASRTGAEFYNQAAIKVGNACVKLFSNGTIHFTGAKSLVHFLDVMDQICTALGLYVPDQNPPMLDAATVLMINVTFCLSRTVPLAITRELFERAKYPASYDPDAYPGVVVKIAAGSREVTAMIFSSGNVIVAGAKAPADIALVYKTICTIIDTLEYPGKPSPLPKFNASTIRTYDIIDGYPARIANLCPEYFL